MLLYIATGKAILLASFVVAGNFGPWRHSGYPQNFDVSMSKCSSQYTYTTLHCSGVSKSRCNLLGFLLLSLASYFHELTLIAIYYMFLLCHGHLAKRITKFKSSKFNFSDNEGKKAKSKIIQYCECCKVYFSEDTVSIP